MIHSGIYQILNTITKEKYIGSSRNIKRRRNSHLHLLKKGKHPTKHLQYAFNKYGIENFEFSILLLCEIDILLIEEQKFINSLKPEYNKRKIAESNFNMPHSEETKFKISVKSKNLWQTNRAKLIEAKYTKPILCYDKNGVFQRIFKGAKEAAQKIGCAPTNVTAVLKGKDITIKGYHFVYKTKEEFPLQIYVANGKQIAQDALKRGIENRKNPIEVYKNHICLGIFESIIMAAKNLNISYYVLHKLYHNPNYEYKQKDTPNKGLKVIKVKQKI